MKTVKYDEGLYAFEAESNEEIFGKSTNRFDQMDWLLDNFEWNGVKVLQEVVDAMSDSEFNEIYQHIIKMWDIKEV
jgi:hypothetical protein